MSEGFTDAEKAAIKRQDDAYFASYASEGCAAEGKQHSFNGDPGDIYTLLYCVDCRMPKKLQASLPGRRVGA